MDRASLIDNGKPEGSHLHGQQGAKECRPKLRKPADLTLRKPTMIQALALALEGNVWTKELALRTGERR